MNHRLHLRLDQLERATEKLLAAAEKLGNRAHLAPAPGQWSAAQVVHHLLATEAAIVAYLQKKVAAEAERLPLAGWGTRLRALLLRLALRLPGLKFKAPRGVGELTDRAEAVAPLPELRRQWAAQRRQLEQLLNEYPGPLLPRAIFRHPRSGLLTIAQTLEFMLDHVLHHQRQVARVASQLANRNGQAEAGAGL